MTQAFIPDFFQLPYNIVRQLGHEKTVLLLRLRDWQKHSNFQGWNLDEENKSWFYHSRKMLQEETLLGEWKVKAFIKEFQDLGILQIEQKGGFDRKAFFCVNLEHPIFGGIPSGGNLPIDREETSQCMSMKPPHASGGNHRMDPTFRKEIKEEIKERHFCEPENPASQPENSVAEISVLFPEPEPELQRTEQTSLAIQSPSKPPKTVSKALENSSEYEDKQTATSQVWKAYSEAYGKKYQGPGGTPIQPPRNARTNQVCKRLVDQYGFQVALGLVNFIFYSKDAYIVRNTHSLLAPNDACWNSLYTQMMSGQRMTQSKANQEDKTGTLDEIARKVLEKLKNKGKAQ